MSRTKRKIHEGFGWFRSPKTQNERKSVASSLEEGVHVRFKRNQKRLPNAWDDKNVAARAEQSKYKK